MSTTHTTAQTTCRAILSAGDDPDDATGDGTWTIHGVALAEDEITNGLNGAKRWPADELEAAAPTLAGETLTAKQGINGITLSGALEETEHGDRVPVGTVTGSAYEPGVGVVYELNVENEDIASALALGQLDISIEATNPDSVDQDPKTNAAIMRGYEFSGMDVVGEGAARSNHTATGPARSNPAIAALSATDIEGALQDGDSDGDGNSDSDSSSNDSTANAADTTSRSDGDGDDDSDGDADGNDDGDGDNDSSDNNDSTMTTATLQSTQTHSPNYSSTSDSAAGFADGSWDRPSMDDFDTDDLSEIDDHFLASESGFPPDSYGDLMLPVVEPDGTLNLNGLQAANQRLSQTDGLSDDQKQSLQSTINRLADDEFDADWSDSDSNSNSNSGSDSDSASESAATAAATDDTDATATTTDATTTTPTTTMSDTNDNDTSTDAEQSTDHDHDQATDLDLDGKVVIDEQRHDELKAKADAAADLEDELDDVKRERDAQQDHITTVQDVYAAALADIGPHDEDFYTEMDLDILATELTEARDADDEQAALEQSVESHPLPQTGDQSVEDADPDADAAALSDERAALEDKLETAEEAGMSGMVDHYESQIAALESGGDA